MSDKARIWVNDPEASDPERPLKCTICNKWWGATSGAVNLHAGRAHGRQKKTERKPGHEARKRHEHTYRLLDAADPTEAKALAAGWRIVCTGCDDLRKEIPNDE